MTRDDGEVCADADQQQPRHRGRVHQPRGRGGRRHRGPPQVSRDWRRAASRDPVLTSDWSAAGSSTTGAPRGSGTSAARATARTTTSPARTSRPSTAAAWRWAAGGLQRQSSLLYESVHGCDGG